MYSKGICWIDDCRIPFEDTPNPATNPKYRLEGGYKLAEKGKISDGSITQFRSSLNETDIRGRFPANILVSDDMLNDGKIDKKGKSKIIQAGKGRGVIGNHDGRKKLTEPKEGLMMARTLGDGGTNSRYYDIDKWFEKILDV